MAPGLVLSNDSARGSEFFRNVVRHLAHFLQNLLFKTKLGKKSRLSRALLEQFPNGGFPFGDWKFHSARVLAVDFVVHLAALLHQPAQGPGMPLAVFHFVVLHYAV